MSDIDDVLSIKPQIGTRVDYGNPLSNDLWMCYQFNEAGGTEVLDAGNMNAGILSFTGSPTPEWTQLGVQVGNGKGHLRNNKTVITPANPIAGSHTLRVIHRPRTWPSSFTCLIDLYDSIAGRVLTVFFNTSGNLNYYCIGGSESGNGTPPDYDQAVGKVSDFVWVFERGDRTDGGIVTYKHYFYVDGVLKQGASGGSGSIVGVGWPATGHDLGIGLNLSGGGANYDGEIILVQGWARGLQAWEVRDLHTSPYAVMSDGPYTLIGKTPVVNATATATFGTITLTAPTATAFEETSATATATFGTIALTAPTAQGSQANTATATFGTITLTAPVASGLTPDNTASASFTNAIYLQAPTCSPYGPPFTVYMQDQYYWGRFSRGQFLNVMWHPEEEPEGVATIEFWHEATTIVKTITLPSLDDVHISYGFNLLLDSKFIDGNYVAVIKFTSGVTDQCSLGYLSVMGGTGSPPVINILEIDRTLGRSVITQDSDGRFMIGYQPQLAAYAVE